MNFVNHPTIILPYCPIRDLSCPYCTPFGKCTIENPEEECDTYCYYNED